MKDCLFCKILVGEVPSTKVFENESVYAFKDIYPQAKEHYLFIHKEHADNFLSNTDAQNLDLLKAIREFSQLNKLESFRIVTNIGTQAGQSVFHTHFHVLGGEKLSSFGA